MTVRRAYVNKSFCATLGAGLLAALAPAQSAEPAPKPAQASINLSGTHGFDFLVGEWRVHHRRISAVSKKWGEFEGTFSHRLLMDGAANIEEHTLGSPEGAYHAVGLRSYDKKDGSMVDVLAR
jgi:hypothetical protein